MWFTYIVLGYISYGDKLENFFYGRELTSAQVGLIQVGLIRGKGTYEGELVVLWLTGSRLRWISL